MLWWEKNSAQYDPGIFGGNRVVWSKFKYLGFQVLKLPDLASLVGGLTFLLKMFMFSSAVSEPSRLQKFATPFSVLQCYACLRRVAKVNLSIAEDSSNSRLQGDNNPELRIGPIMVHFKPSESF